MAGRKSVNRLGIKFSSEAMLDALYGVFESGLEYFASVLIAEMTVRADYSSINQSFVTEWIVKEKGTEMAIAVGNSHWGAFLANYGTGSKMSTENPLFLEYAKGKTATGEQIDINPHRVAQRWAIVGRPKGKYRTPNWKDGHGVIPRTSKGTMEGKNLEHMVKPQSPTHFLERTFEAKSQEFYDFIMGEIERFPFHYFIEGGGV